NGDGSFTDNEVGLTLIGFETLTDGAGNDTYEITDLTNFFDTFVSVIDTAGDHDTLKLDNGSLGNSAAHGVNHSHGSIELDDFEDAIDGNNDGVENFDFDKLDISSLTQHVNTVITNDANETVRLGDISNIGQTGAPVDVQGFKAIEFTTTAGMGTSVV